jgi:C4-dicarboxylate-specific signal transduction histidine kinase
MNNNNRSLKQTYLTSLSQLSENISSRIDKYMDNADRDIKKIDNLVNLIFEDTNDLENNQIDYKEDLTSTICSLKSQFKNVSRLKQYLKYKTELSKKAKNEFKIGDVINRIKLLTKDELEENFCKLKIIMKISQDTLIRGHATSLVQVLLIHIINACHAYKNSEGNIYFFISKEDNNIILQIHDDAEKSTEFHESFIKTDIYMSYMLIKNEFNGTVWFESQNNGTSFFISFSN